MVAQAAPTAADQSNVRGCLAHPREGSRPRSEQAVLDNRAPTQCETELEVREHPPPDAEIVYGGEVSSDSPQHDYINSKISKILYLQRGVRTGYEAIEVAKFCGCVYRKLKPGRSDGEAHRGSGVNE